MPIQFNSEPNVQHSTEDQCSPSERGEKHWAVFMLCAILGNSPPGRLYQLQGCFVLLRQEKPRIEPFLTQSGCRTICSSQSCKMQPTPSNHHSAVWGGDMSTPVLWSRSQRERGGFGCVNEKWLSHYSCLDWVTPPLAKLNFHYRSNSRWC